MQNAINWFEIPTNDYQRAIHFYETIFGFQLRQEIFNGEPNALFPTEGQESAGGAVISRANHKPSMDGSLTYLNTDGKMTAILSRIEKAGGKVLLPRTSIGDPGYIALFVDSEGNKVGLHEPG